MKRSRRCLREREPRSGTILFSDGSSIVKCTMRNYSSQGALLKLHQPIHLSSDIVLAVEGETERLLCRVVWRQGNLLGVLFKSDWTTIDHASGDQVDETNTSKISTSSRHNN